MKKSLITLAVLASISATANAQSTVTVYGIVDTGIVKITNANSSGQTLTGLESGALSTSRLGFKGSEDLGGGLKASFLLESELKADTGANDGVLFKRGSWVQLSQNDIGSITLGRQNRFDYTVINSIDPFHGSNIGGFIPVAYKGSRPTLTDRIDNAVTLQTAKFSGLSFAYQRELGEQAGDTKSGSTDTYNADYTNGKLRLSATSVKSYGTTAPIAQDEKSTHLFASYDFGFANPVLGHIDSQAASGAVKVKVNMLGVSVPVTTGHKVVVGYYDIKNSNKVATDANGKVYAMNYIYELSKRTSLYALWAQSNVDSGASIAVANLTEQKAGTNHVQGKNTSATAFGIRHSF